MYSLCQDHVFAASSKTSSLSEFLLYSKDHDLGNISNRSDGSEAVENEGGFTTDREYFNTTYYNNIFYDELNDDTKVKKNNKQSNVYMNLMVKYTFTHWCIWKW